MSEPLQINRLATFGLLLTILGAVRFNPAAVPWCVVPHALLTNLIVPKGAT